MFIGNNVHDSMHKFLRIMFTLLAYLVRKTMKQIIKRKKLKILFLMTVQNSFEE